ncbi:alpha/beta hydrolase [Actinoplanes sp. NPDC051859]|uniref:alpha/beta hydrolase n=1 Tax=Actinoplanes sp. NPDC051859 TaxID=3363909 RepID=UPI0037A5F775
MNSIVITSGWLIALLGALTVLAAVATAKFWDRGRFRTAHRAAGLILVQLLLLLSIGAVVNKQANFYVTLGELLGQSAPDGYAATIPHNAPRLTSDNTGHDAIARWIAEHPGGADKGTVIPAMLTGARTGYHLPAQIYLPAGYTAPEAARRDYPVVMFLAGYPGTVDSWLKTMGVGAALDKAINARALPPMIAVLPEQDPVRGKDSECVDSATGVRADTFLTSDVPEILTRHFRAASGPENWAVAGYSTGGFCAFNLALRHPDKFSAAASLSGYFRPIIDRSTGDLYQGDLNLRRANDPRLTINERRPRPMHLFLSAGLGDKEALADLHAYRPLIRTPDVATVYDSRPGGHNFATWNETLPALFQWLNGWLAAHPDRGQQPDTRTS